MRITQRISHGFPGYNGELHEPVRGWQMLGNGYRAYSAVLMRFQSPDSLSPFGAGGLRAYAYCGNDPVNLLDHSGHFLQYVGAGLAVAAAVAGAGVAVAKGADDPHAAAILEKIVLGLGVAAAVAVGGFAVHRGIRAASSRRASRAIPPVDPAQDVGQPINVGDAVFFPGKERDIIRAHGNRFVTGAEGPVSGRTLGQQIKAKVGPDYAFKTTEFQRPSAEAAGREALEQAGL